MLLKKNRYMKTSRFILLNVMMFINASLIHAQIPLVGKYTFPENGAIYYGELKDGKPNGKGKTTFKYGDTYEGEYVKGKFQGYGVFTFRDGEKYEGNWYQDHLHGHGIYYFANNDKYEGQWYMDFQQGDGTMYYYNGDKYTGEWKQDKREGQGRYTWANNSYYDGSWVNDKKSGKGVFVWSDGSSYEGYMDNDMRNGEGKYTNANGDIYTGEWKDDMMHGKGTYKSKRGDYYEGDYSYGQRNGQGRYAYFYGDIYVGSWKNNQKNGNGILTKKNGEIVKGIWENDNLIHQNEIVVTEIPSNDNYEIDKRTIQVTVSVIDTLEAERLFYPIKDSLLILSQTMVNKHKRIQELLEPSQKKEKTKEIRKNNEKEEYNPYKNSPKKKEIAMKNLHYDLKRKKVETSEDLALLSDAYSFYPYQANNIQKDIQKGKLTMRVVDCLNLYDNRLSDNISIIHNKIELGWEKYLPQAGIPLPQKEIITMVKNPYYRGYHYNDADTLDLIERHQQRKGWEFLYASNNRVYKEDTYPAKFNYYVYNEKPQYKVDKDDYTVYNTQGQLVYIPSLTRDKGSVFAEIKRLVYLADYKNNKYNILSESQRTQKFLNRMIGEKGGTENSFAIGAGIAIAIAFSATPYAYLTGNSLSPRQRGKMIDDFQKDFRDPVGEEYIKQLVKDHERDFGYIYVIERVSNVSFRVVYINSGSLKPSYCALITYKTGTKPFTKDFSAKLINVPVNLPSIPIEED